MLFSVVHVVVTATLLLSPVEAAMRTLAERQAAGECATGTFQDMFRDGKVTGPLPSDGAVTGDVGITSADNIEILYGGNFKVLTEKYSQEAYVLTQCGTQRPNSTQIDAVVGGGLPAAYTVKHFDIPLQAVGIGTTIVLDFFEVLGIQDRVKFLSQYSSGPCWGKALGCSSDSKVTNVATQIAEVDGWFMDRGSGNTHVSTFPKGIHCSATQDQGPLHTAEHIKFVAAFFNKEKAATDFFNAQVTSYTQLKTLVPNKPTVAWINAGVNKLTVSMATYKLLMVEHAGGTNVDGAALEQKLPDIQKTTASTGVTYDYMYTAGDLANASEAFFGALEELGVAAVIDEKFSTPPSGYTMASFTTTYGIPTPSTYGFVTNQMVFRYDGTHAENDYGGFGVGLAWFESRISRPASAAEGLARVLHEDSSKSKWFFRNIAKGETPDVLLESSCQRTLSQCTADAVPQVIELMDNMEVGAAAGMASFGLLSALLALFWSL